MDDKDHTGDKEFLTNRAIKFFAKYGPELEQISKLLEIRLNQLCLAYTLQNNLPRESMVVKARVKTLKSFLKKIEKAGWPNFYYIKNVVNDLIGARITCWFNDDCKGIYNYIIENKQFSIVSELTKDYINNPKISGYRSIHVFARITYDRVKSDFGTIKLVEEDMNCEVQIRTKLMDTWADLTHEFHYKAKDLGIEDKGLESLLKSQADRFFIEDESFIIIRNMYQKMIAKNDKPNKEGFTDEK